MSVTTKKDAFIAKIPAHVRITEAVKNAIFSGQLEPGDSILELHLAREHKVSQTTVRESLANLQQAGFVRRIPNKGTFVIKLSPQELREHLRLRVVLEALAGVEASRWMNKRGVEQLQKRLQSISDAVERNEYYEIAIADLEFHRCIWELSGDETLQKILDQLCAPLFAFASIRRSTGHEQMKQVVLAHEPLIAALVKGRPEEIRIAVRVHVETSYSHFLNSDLGDFEDLPQIVQL